MTTINSNRKRIVIAPQPGPQENFVATSADIAIYGGAAGGGKTFALLLDPLRHIKNPKFGAVLFRKNYTQITNQGGLWDSSMSLYSKISGAMPLKTPKLHWQFETGAKISFAHLASNIDCNSWQGSQITMVGFDELTHFSKYQFFYMLSRNRSDSGISPYIRATCNPDADSWVAEFISWWIDQNTGYPIAERSGVIRWMVHINEKITWFPDRESAVAYASVNGMSQSEAEIAPKSVTFIASTLQDNKILMESDPSYIANLLALPEVEKERLLKGNWKIKPAAGSFFKRSQIGEMLEKIPGDIISLCRAWDLAATDEDEGGDPAYTAGVLMGKRACGRFIILNVINARLKAGDVRKTIKNTAIADNAKYGYVRVRLPQDPGQAGKAQAEDYVQFLAGYDVITRLESGSKITRAEPMAAQWQQGFFDVLIGEWNDEYFSQLESFPESKFKDMVDAGSSAFGEITLGMNFNINNLL